MAGGTAPGRGRARGGRARRHAARRWPRLSSCSASAPRSSRSRGAGALFRAYPAERRGWALGVRQMAVPLGGMIGAVLVPALETLGGVSTVLHTAAAGVGLTGAAFAVVPTRCAAGRQPGGFRTILRPPGCSGCSSSPRSTSSSCRPCSSTRCRPRVPPGCRRSQRARRSSRSRSRRGSRGSSGAGSRIGGGGARRVRTLVEAGVVAAVGALLFTVALQQGAARRAPRGGRLRLRRAGLERARLRQRRRARAAGACRRVGRRRRDGRSSGSRQLRRRRSAPSRTEQDGTRSGWRRPPSLVGSAVAATLPGPPTRGERL